MNFRVPELIVCYVESIVIPQVMTCRYCFWLLWLTSCLQATYLDSADDQNEKVEPKVLEKDNKFIAMQKFEAKQDDEVGFDKNAVVVVKEKRLDGWWLVAYDGKEGWAPGSFLKKMVRSHLLPNRSDPPNPNSGLRVLDRVDGCLHVS